MRGMISVFAGAAAFVGMAGVLPAQQKQTTPEKKEARTICYSTDNSRTECQKISRFGPDSAMMKRAALGIQLGSTGTVRDTLGVFVERVTPKGPAENAGIVEGDRIVSINGVDLRVSSADAGDEYASELPSRRLTREVQKLSPGAVANLRVYSGGRVRDVRVTAARASDLVDRNFFGGIGPIGDGMGGMTIRSFPKMNMNEFYGPRMRIESMPRIPMEELDRMKLENLPMLREHLRDLPMRIHENMEPMRMRLREDGLYKTLEPSRVRVIGPEGSVYIYRDSTGTLRKAKTRAEREAVEKEKKEQKK